MKIDYMSSNHEKLLDLIDEGNLGLCSNCRQWGTDDLLYVEMENGGYIACVNCRQYWPAPRLDLDAAVMPEKYKYAMPFYHKKR